MNRVIHFDIHADDPERAVKFYTDVFGWVITKYDAPGMPPYWTVTTGPSDEPGINGGLTERRGEQSGDRIMAYVCTVDVPSIDQTLRTVESAGGNTVVPKAPVPGIGWLAYCHDTEGNVFGILQGDANAK